MNDDVMVVSTREAKTVRRVATTPEAPWRTALKAGQMVFIPNPRRVAYGGLVGRWPKRMGLMVRQRKATRDGVVGYYVWTEPRNAAE